MSFGVGVRGAWPWTGLAIASLLALTVVRVFLVVWYRVEERLRAWNHLLILASTGGLAVALGFGRNGFEPRYVTLLFPLLLAVYFAWTFFGDDPLARLIRAALAVTSLLIVWPNTQFGVEYGRKLSERLGQFEDDLRDGMPKSRLIARYASVLHPLHQLVNDNIGMLRDVNFGPFAKLRDDPPMRHVPVAPDEWRVSGGTREGRTIIHQGNAWITVSFAQPTLVAGIRMVFRADNALHRVPFVRLEWRQGKEPFGSPDRYYALSPTGDRGNWERYSYARRADPAPNLLCWLWATVSEFRIQPDYIPGVFEIHELELLEPAGS